MIATIDGVINSHWETCLCGNYSEMRAVAVGHESKFYDDNSFSVEVYKVLRCPNCKSVLVLKYSSGAEEHELEDHDYRNRGAPMEFSFERKILFCTPIPRESGIPSPISDVLNQAHSVVEASPRAAFILCRAALEEVCRAFGVVDSVINKYGDSVPVSLASRLDKLIAQEKLPGDLSEILHGIRQLGNEGAHGAQDVFGSTVRSEEVTSVLGLLEFVLDRLYVDRIRSQKAMIELSDLKIKVLRLNSSEKQNQGNQKTESP